MERVDTLIKKLQQQFAEGAPIQQLLFTVQMLETELVSLQGNQPISTGHINIDIPQTILPHLSSETQIPIEENEKIFEILQVDEAEMEAEIEEIKRNAAAVQQMSLHTKPQIVFEDEDELLPTLAHKKPIPQKKELNEMIAADSAGEKISLNDKLKQSQLELSDSLSEVHIKDLRKAIGVNDRFHYIKELFRGDESMYERSIKTINGFSILPEAEYWIQRELKVKLGWNDNNETVKQFTQLVKRRFT